MLDAADGGHHPITTALGSKNGGRLPCWSLCAPKSSKDCAPPRRLTKRRHSREPSWAPHGGAMQPSAVGMGSRVGQNCKQRALLLHKLIIGPRRLRLRQRPPPPHAARSL